MHDFSCTNPNDMYYDVLAERVRVFKESKEGVSIMCKVIEDMRKEEREAGIREGMKQGMKQGMMTTARRMLETGKYALEEIADISGLSFDELKTIQNN